MVSTTAGYQPTLGKLDARPLERLFRFLFLVGLFSLAAVQSCSLERLECGPFTIGRSAVGSCDYIAG